MGIRDASRQKIISGARVAFDPRSTAQAHTTRDEKNYKAAEQPYRRALWEERQREAARANKKDAAR